MEIEIKKSLVKNWFKILQDVICSEIEDIESNSIKFISKEWKRNIKKDNILFFDSKISPSALNIDFFSEINSLSPFGSGNPEPRFVIENLKLLKSSIVGDKHIKALLSASDGSVIKSVTFNAVKTDLETYLLSKNQKKINIVGKLSLNEWKGQKNVEFIIDDISVNKTINNSVPSSNG